MQKLEALRPLEQLGSLSLKDLQRYGVEHSAELPYRVEVSRRMAVSSGAGRAIIFDDTMEIQPADQHANFRGVIRSERNLLSGLMMAPGFDHGAAVLVASPPLPSEIGYIDKYKKSMEDTLGRPVNFQILLEHGDALVDLMDLDRDQLEELASDFTKELVDKNVDHFYAGYHTSVISDRLPEIMGDAQRALVVPYQTTAGNHDFFRAEIEAGTVVLPDIPNMDKAYNNLLLRDNNFPYLPEMHVITSSGRIIASFEELEEDTDFMTEIPKTAESVERFAIGIVEAVDRLEQQGKGTYIKLDPCGASGRGNLDPGVYPDLYDPTIPNETKIQIIAGAISSLHGSSLPPSAVVEEFIDADEIEGIPRDYTVSVQVVDGIALPISVNHVGTTKGAYDRQWSAPQAPDIGEAESDWRDMFGIYTEMGAILAQHGYRNGILAGDVFVGTDGKYSQHDWNERRGGRSTPEALLALDPQGWFDSRVNVTLADAQVEVPLKQRVQLHAAVCEMLIARGIKPYSTNLRYQGDNDGHKVVPNLLKFYLLAPMTTFERTDGTTLPRNEHLDHMEQVILDTIGEVRARQ